MDHIAGAQGPYNASGGVRQKGLASLKLATEKLASRKTNGTQESAAEVTVSHKAMLAEDLDATAEQIDSDHVALKKANDLLAKMRKLALTRAHPQTAGEQKEALAREFRSLKAELSRLLDDADFNGLHQVAAAPPSLPALTASDSRALDAVHATTVTNIASADLSVDDLNAIEDVIEGIGSERLKVGVAQSRLEYARSVAEGGGSRVRDRGDAENLTKSTSDLIRDNPGSMANSQGTGPESTLELLGQ